MPRAGEESVAALGLTSQEAAALLREHGENTVPRPRPPRWWSRVLRQLRDPMIALLLAAAAVTVATGDVTDTVIIAVVVVLNTALGVAQEWRAERAVRALDRLAAPWARVRRDGLTARVPASSVVPGDLLLLEAGDVVGADGDVVDAVMLQVDESALTGESLPRACGPGDEVESGATVTRGRGEVRVTRTGADSGFGRITSMVASARVPATPMQRRLGRLSGELVVAVLVLAAVVMVLGVARGRPLAEMLVVALSLAVAAVPESLPAVVSIALALGAHRMARRRAVVRHLPAVETLGSVTVLASDKTGTLTEGHMAVEALWTPRAGWAPSGAAATELVRDLVLCNDARATPPEAERDGDDRSRDLGDPIERALLLLATRSGVDVEATRAALPRVAERPFDAATRRMTTLHRTADGPGWLLVCKGAPEAVLPRVRDAAAREEAARRAAEAASHGHRVLLVATAETRERPGLDADGLEVAGLVSLRDPPRASAAGVVARLQAAGIRVVLVTGDHPATATAVAQQVGILDASPVVVEGPGLTAGDVGADLGRVGVVARVRPEQKVDVVRLLHERGEIVAMTGDGVNDAPALRTADIGVAMGRSGTEVARQAAALVLADDELATLGAAVEEGRRVYDNIRSFLRYGLAGGTAEVLVMLVGPLLGIALPLVPAQILWVNMLTHGLPGVAFGTEPADPRSMRRPSRSPERSILGDGLAVQVALSGAMIAVCSLLAGLLAPHLHADVRTSIFLTLGLGQLSVAWALRSRVKPRPLGQRSLEGAVLLALVAQVAGVYVPALTELLSTQPLPLSAAAACALLAVPPGLQVVLAARPGTSDPAPRRVHGAG